MQKTRIAARNSPFTNLPKCDTIFPYGKLVEEESTCVHHTTGKSPEDFFLKQTETISSLTSEGSETERDVQAQMEDGFGEALLTRFWREYQSPF